MIGWGLILSILGGYKISEWICGPWIKKEDIIEEQQSNIKPEFVKDFSHKKLTSKFGIEFDNNKED